MKAVNSRLKISLKEAQLLLLKEQGLINTVFPRGKKGVLSIIHQLGYLQIDTLNVVSRSHHHTIWSRLPGYKEHYLYQLLEIDHSIFEYWSHAASYLPMSDFRFSLPRKRLYAEGKSHWFPQDKKINKYVLDRIKAEGALQSKDFEFKRSIPGNWYNWKPAKQALEQLFMEGKLMISKRQNFQKVYDLTERVLPKNVDTSFPSKSEFTEYLIKRAITAYGIVTENEVGYLRKGLKEEISKKVRSMIKSGELMELEIETLKEVYITTAEKLKILNIIENNFFNNNPNTNLHILSPFDNALIQRKRLNNLFGFDFNIECYLPSSKRKYGYWSLPVLYKGKFIGRFDPKADRKSKIFYLKSVHFDKDVIDDEDFNKAFSERITEFSVFNSCDSILIEKADKLWKNQILAQF